MYINELKQISVCVCPYVITSFTIAVNDVVNEHRQWCVCFYFPFALLDTI